MSKWQYMAPEVQSSYCSVFLCVSFQVKDIRPDSLLRVHIKWETLPWTGEGQLTLPTDSQDRSWRGRVPFPRTSLQGSNPINLHLRDKWVDSYPLQVVGEATQNRRHTPPCVLTLWMPLLIASREQLIVCSVINCVFARLWRKKGESVKERVRRISSDL